MKNVYIFPDSLQLAASFSEVLYQQIASLLTQKNKITISLSGGNTPKLLFSELAGFYNSKIRWDRIHFFWVDERCVPPDHNESNYGMAKKHFFDRIIIPAENIHRIIGENDPDEEAQRYTNEVHASIDSAKYPSYDITIMGIGEDGHTASIFPDQMHLLEAKELYVHSIHPVTHQSRISMSGTFINNSGSVYFMVSGRSKSGIVKALLNSEQTADNYPANYICPVSNNLFWYLDQEAAELLDQ